VSKKERVALKGMNGTSASFDNFIQMLRKLAQGYWGLDGENRKHLQMLLDRLLKGVVSITFGGHFSSGKSTLINAALGRLLLPTLDYPETGAICAIRAGERDHVEVLTTNGRRTIDCTTAAIAQEIRLTTPTGSLNTKVLQVQQVNITLATRVIPSGAIWIDSPGINESPEMYDRASEAARMGDILVWVLNSRQFLSLSEEEFLTEYIAERGPAAVIFVSNAFLQGDTPEYWNTYHAQSFPGHLKKLHYRASFMSYAKQNLPEVISVSARALSSYKGDDFGGREFRNLLNELSHHEHPRIRRARLLLAAITLHAMAAQIEARLKLERERVKQAQAVYQQAQQKVDQNKKRFAAEMERAFTHFLFEWRANAQAGEKDVLRMVNSGRLLRDNTYSFALNNALKKAAVMAIGRWCSSIDRSVEYYEQKHLNHDNVDTLWQMLTPQDVVVHVPDTVAKLSKDAVAHIPNAVAKLSKEVADLSARIGNPEIGQRISNPEFGRRIDEWADSVIGRVAPHIPYTPQQDVIATQVNITNATQQAIASVEAKRTEALKFIVEHCVSTSSVSAPDSNQLHLLEKQFQLISELANQGEALAGGQI